MSLAEPKPRVAMVEIVNDLQHLARITNKRTEAVVWNRDIPDNQQAWFNGLLPEAFKDGRYNLDIDDIYECVTQHFQALGYGQSPELEWLAQDVRSQALQLVETFSVSTLRLRIEMVTDNACPKFHTDNVKARLICTYFGPGTDYGVTEDRSSPEQVHRVPTGSSILLKGLKWSASEKRCLKHRSPPIEGTGKSRFVVVIEPATSDTMHMNKTFAAFD